MLWPTESALPPLPPDMRKLGTLDSNAKRQRKADWMVQHGIEFQGTNTGIDRAFAQASCIFSRVVVSPSIIPSAYALRLHDHDSSYHVHRHGNGARVQRPSMQATRAWLTTSVSVETLSDKPMAMQELPKCARPAVRA